MFSQTTGDEICHLRQRPEIKKKHKKPPTYYHYYHDFISEFMKFTIKIIRKQQKCYYNFTGNEVKG